MPVTVFSGENCIKNNSDVFTSLGKRAFLVCANSSKKNGALDDVLSLLDKKRIAHEEDFSAIPNPTLENVGEIAKKAKAFSPDFIITIGGGSVMDAAKAVGVLVANPGYKPCDVYKPAFEKDSLPIIAVPTTCGTGSEVSGVSVLTVGDNKKSFGHASIFPKAAFLDARYLETLPERILLDTLIDALAHAAEGFMMYDHPIADMLCMEVFRKIKKVKPYLKRENYSKEVLGELLYLAMLAGVALSINGTSAVHAMGYPLTVHKGYSHGRACGVLLGGYIDMVKEVREDKVRDMLDALGLYDVSSLCAFIENVLEPNAQFSSSEIEKYTEISALPASKKNNPIPFGKKEVAELYNRSLF